MKKELLLIGALASCGAEEPVDCKQDWFDSYSGSVIDKDHPKIERSYLINDRRVKVYEDIERVRNAVDVSDKILNEYGLHRTEWDGTNDRGEIVGNGSYNWSIIAVTDKCVDVKTLVAKIMLPRD